MNEVRRYRLGYDPDDVPEEACTVMLPSQEGRWVEYTDYDALASRVQAVERDNRTYIDERHELLTKNEALIQQLADMTRERDEAKRSKNQCVIELYQKLDKLDDTYNTLFAASHVQADELARVTAQLTQADQQVARLRTKLKELGYEDETLY